jgi:hypothetical protein
MPKTMVGVNVNFNTDPPTSAPDPVTVNRSANDGVIFTANKTGFTFTGVLIGTVAAPTGDFGTPVISSNNAGNSTMAVPDTVADISDYSYTLEYTGPDGNPGQFDPKIKNKL